MSVRNAVPPAIVIVEQATHPNGMHEIRAGAVNHHERLLIGYAVSYEHGQSIARAWNAHGDLVRLLRMVEKRVDDNSGSPTFTNEEHDEMVAAIAFASQGPCRMAAPVVEAIWCCPACGSTDVQSLEWCRFDVARQEWISVGDIADPSFWCEGCQTHPKSLEQPRATPAMSAYDDLVEAAQAARAVFAKQRWVAGSNDPEAVALRLLTDALAKATKGGAP